MINWWAANYYTSLGWFFLASWAFWMISSIVLHELGHGWAALACGDGTPREQGHMTLNPVKHMGWTSLLIFAATGIAWGRMPINPARFRGPHDFAVVALAGPAVNLLLASLALIVNVVWIAIAGGYWFSGVSVSDPLFGNVQMFLRVGAMLNLALTVFNLIPVPPLDGSKVLARYFPPYRVLFSTEGGRVAALVLFFLVFMKGGTIAFGLAMDVTHNATTQLLRLVAPAAQQRPPR